MPERLHTCPRCQEDGVLRQREFSHQAQAALLVWEEMQPSQVNKPLCTPCYDELREVLIERASELEAAAKQPVPTKDREPEFVATKKAAGSGLNPKGAKVTPIKQATPAQASSKPAAKSKAKTKATAKAKAKVTSKSKSKSSSKSDSKSKSKNQTKSKSTSKAKTARKAKTTKAKKKIKRAG